MTDYNWITKESKLPWLVLDIDVPYKEMHTEAVSLREEFVAHRDQDYGGGYRHQGWRSLCIHGIDAYKTNHYDQYGFKNNDEVPYCWTHIAERCPVTVDFFKNKFPYKRYHRLRFMLLEPGGFITPHEDTDQNVLSPVNIALNTPKDCMFKMKGHKGFVPLTDGKAVLLDVGNTHAVYNKSDEDRYHIIVHGVKTKEYEDLVKRSYAKNGN
tara:strand:+ start:3779 stop:4411 length:633 start_codon:yes stop_codon:yes gene_type:complete